MDHCFKTLINYLHEANESTTSIYLLGASLESRGVRSVPRFLRDDLNRSTLSKIPLLIQSCFDSSAKILKHARMPVDLIRYTIAVQDNMLRSVLEVFNISCCSSNNGMIILLEELRDNDFRIRLAYLADVLFCLFLRLLSQQEDTKKLTFWFRHIKSKHLCPTGFLEVTSVKRKF